eukprot:COSAG02_NODE_54711_length_294_cov_1.323077_1_plen_36_part_10
MVGGTIPDAPPIVLVTSRLSFDSAYTVSCHHVYFLS